MSSGGSIARARVVSASARGEAARRAGELAERLGIPWDGDRAGEGESGETDPPDADVVLSVDEDRVELRDAAEPGAPGVWVDFLALANRLRRAPPGKRQPIVRAFGPDVRTIVDATAGLGQDSFLLATYGFEVVAIERSPVVAALLEDGWRRLVRGAPEVAARLRLTFRQGDARTLLADLEPPDAVYLDPMFPPKRKSSALAKKPVRLLRKAVGEDPDAASLLAVGRRTARRRVVVKRADDAPSLAPDAVARHEGKLVRFDVYRPLPAGPEAEERTAPKEPL